MAVAVKSIPEIATPRNPHQQWMMASAIGAAYVLFSFWLIFSGLPTLWVELGIFQDNIFLADAILLLATIPVVAGLFVVGQRLAASHPPAGTRAGAAYLALLAFVTVWITLNLGAYLETRELGAGALVLTLISGVGLLAFGWLLFLYFGRTGFFRRLEAQGWFHATAFKGNQGRRVRLGTIIALMVLLLCGIYTMITHRMVGSGRWEWPVPFVPGKILPILYQVQLTVPILLFAAACWISWRIVNFPAFADFLIATEAEMNKVSWTTRKKLVQDTIVVLVTVALFTIFLFVVDILWIKVLTNPLLEVLKVDTMAERAKQNAPTDW